MSFIYNPESTHKTRTLRKRHTDTERFLWSKIKARQIGGFKFYRQYPIDNYIVDFYCPEKGLAVELDGGQHVKPYQKAYDKRRTRILKQDDITVLRFWDSDVLKHIDTVLEIIYRQLNAL